MSTQTPSSIVFSKVCSSLFENLESKASLISRVLELCADMTQGQHCTLYLTPQKDLKIFYTYHTSGERSTLPSQNGLAGFVYRTKQPLLSNNLQNDKRLYPKIDTNIPTTTQNILAVPLTTPEGKTLGVIEITNSKNGGFNESDLNILQVLALFSAIALEARDLRDELIENSENHKQNHANWITRVETVHFKSQIPSLKDIFTKLPHYAQSDSPILLEGPNGSGKRTLAQWLHTRSRRKTKPFVTLRCRSIPETELESVLFGVAPNSRGKFELATGGTLFIDEIDTLPLPIQSKLLQILQNKTITKLGNDETPISVDFRLIASTRKNLHALVESGKFREDLFFRINVVHLGLLPLSERKSDFGTICNALLEQIGIQTGWKGYTVESRALCALQFQSWPGNLHQLRNSLENAILLAGERKNLKFADFFSAPPQTTPSEYGNLRLVKGNDTAPSSEALDSNPANIKTEEQGPNENPGAKILDFNLRRAKELFENDLIQKALQETGGNKSQAAKLLGITREGLRKAMKKSA